MMGTRSGHDNGQGNGNGKIRRFLVDLIGFTLFTMILLTGLIWAADRAAQLFGKV